MGNVAVSCEKNSTNTEQVAFVDDEDYVSLAQYKWAAHKDGNTFYAVRSMKTQKGGGRW